MSPRNPNVWLSKIDLGSWSVYEFSTGAVHGPFDKSELRTWVQETGKDPSKLKYVPRGLYTGFNVDQLLSRESSPVETVEQAAPSVTEPVAPPRPTAPPEASVADPDRVSASAGKS